MDHAEAREEIQEELDNQDIDVIDEVAVDPFDLGALIAQGECFAVYEQAAPSQPGAQRWVIKQALDPLCTQPAFVERLRWLADKLHILRHPNIEEVAEIRAAPGGCALLCERVDGQTLSDVLQQGARLTVEDARLVCSQICDALAAAHSLGLAHGNLTPERIVFTRPYEPGSPSIKLRGFGLGRLLGCDLFGTSPYLAPEQVELFSPRPAATPQTDQFVLAALLIEMLTGRRAFSGGSVAEVRHKLLHQDPRQIEWVGAAPDDVRRVHRALERALAKIPEQRYRSVHAFVEALMPRSHGSALAPAPQPAQQLPIHLVVGGNLQVVVQDMPTLQVRAGALSGENTLPAIRLEPIQIGQLMSSMAGAAPRRAPDPNATLPLQSRLGTLPAAPTGSAPQVGVPNEEPRLRQRSRWVRPLLLAAILTTVSFALLTYASVHQQGHPSPGPVSPHDAPGGAAVSSAPLSEPSPSLSEPKPAKEPKRRGKPAAAKKIAPPRSRSEAVKPAARAGVSVF